MFNQTNSPRPKETLPAYNLMQEISDATYFKEIGNGLHRKIYRIGDSNICMKVPHPEHFTPTILYLMQCEFMMYQISHIWNFDVVPFTKVILHNSKEIEQITEAFTKVNKGDHLYYPLLIQKYIEPENLDRELDLVHAQKVLIFNWITGRQDRARTNSVVNSEGKIFEVDNELTFNTICVRTEPHWLLDSVEFPNIPLKENLIEGILNLPQMIPLKLETLPGNHVVHSHPRARQIKASRNVTVMKVQNQVIDNLITLKSIIRNLQKSKTQITPQIIEDQVKNLGKQNYAS